MFEKMSEIGRQSTLHAIGHTVPLLVASDEVNVIGRSKR